MAAFGPFRPCPGTLLRCSRPALPLVSGPRGVAQPGRAPALGAGCRVFKSRRPDQCFQRDAGCLLPAGREGRPLWELYESKLARVVQSCVARRHELGFPTHVVEAAGSHAPRPASPACTIVLPMPWKSGRRCSPGRTSSRTWRQSSPSAEAADSASARCVVRPVLGVAWGASTSEESHELPRPPRRYLAQGRFDWSPACRRARGPAARVRSGRSQRDHQIFRALESISGEKLFEGLNLDFITSDEDIEEFCRGKDLDWNQALPSRSELEEDKRERSCVPVRHARDRAEGGPRD